MFPFPLYEAVDVHHALPFAEEGGDALPSRVGKMIEFAQASVVLLRILAEAAAALQPFQDGIQGGFGHLYAGRKLFDDAVAVGILVRQGGQDADFQQTAFQLSVLAIKESLCRSKEDKGNVYFIMDEFRLLRPLSHMDNGINFGRSRLVETSDPIL